VTKRLAALAPLCAVVLAVAGCSDPQPTPRERAAPVERPIYQLKGPTARLRVPTAALIEHAVVPGVFVLSTSGEARFRMVRPGRIVGGETEILAGLVGDETLVLGDLKTLHDGSPVTAVKSAK
jgi:hypothetical protein